jgi:hypothetical protein
MDPTTQIVTELVRQGLLGLIIAAVLTGWIVPKWVIDEYRRREEIKDATIERQSGVIERLAEKAGGQRPRDQDA